MKRSLIKDTFREITKSISRFLSIFAIVAIGVAFFAGIKAAAPNMKNSADAYFDQDNIMDIRLVSTFGFTKEDIRGIKQIEGLSGVLPTYTKDVLSMFGSQEKVLKVHALPTNTSKENSNYINQVELIEGRMPANSNECVIEKAVDFEIGVNIGDTITIYSGTKDAIEDSFNATEFKVVGYVKTANYLSFEKGPSSIGNGSVSTFIMVPESAFNMEYYTEVLLTIDGALSYNSYSDSYFDFIQPIKNKLDALGVERVEVRYQDILDEANLELEEGKQEFEDAKKEYEEEITKAEKKLEDAKYELIRGEILLQVQKDNTKAQLESAQQQIDSAKKMIEEGEKQYVEAKKQFETINKTVLDEIASEEKKLAAFDLSHPGLVEQNNLNLTKKAQLEKDIADKQANLDKLDQNDPSRPALELEIANLQTELNSVDAQITADATLIAERNQIVTRIERLKQGISTGQTALDQMRVQLDTSKEDLKKQEQKLEDGKKTAEVEFAKAEQKLTDGKKELADGEKTFKKEKLDAEEKLLEAEEKLARAQKDIDNIPEPEWFILDRESHYGYRDYGSSADRMEAISQVFPLFFFLVAALVCLTTMTRMVDEQRQTIGTLKALGYSKVEIAYKYLIYAAIASIAGSIVGLAIGMTVFPTVIFEAWNIKFIIPQQKFLLQVPLMIMTTIFAVCVTTLSTLGACYKELLETPSLLMRPKAPKVGKTILLERWTNFWKRLTFSEKVTARNIFRYKKRFLMTVVGISGCTALLLAGFGIKDSVGSVADLQFGKLFKYNVSAQYENDLTASEKEDMLNQIQEDAQVKDAMEVSSTAGTLYLDKEEVSITIVVPKDIDDFEDYVELQHRTSQRSLSLSDEGAIISEKVAMKYGLKVNDEVTLANAEGYKETVKIVGITENYVDHFIYMTPSYYKNTYEVRAEINSVLIKLKNSTTQIEDNYASQLMKEDNIKSVITYGNISDSFQDMISSLNIVVIVLIISSGLLAFVVLYNLSNVNISERLREIATIKVLGFTDKEVSKYVNRESIVLTIVGAIFGLLLGIILHNYIMNVAELDNVMFGRTIYPLSYLYSFIITLIFSAFVNRVMHKKLRKIPMVESLKSVE